jgi:hypothetical protein
MLKKASFSPAHPGAPRRALHQGAFSFGCSPQRTRNRTPRRPASLRSCQRRF